MIRLTDEWTKRGLAQAIEGAYYDYDEKAWVLDRVKNVAQAQAVLKLFPHVANEHPEVLELRDTLAADARPTNYAERLGWRVRGVAAPVHQELLNAGHDFYAFQDIDLGYVRAVLEKHGAAYIGWERGLGKTLGAAALIEATGAVRTLVVCPNTAKESVWAAELRRFLPDHFIEVLPNDKKRRERVLERSKSDRYRQGRPLVLVVHYEALGVIAGKEKTKAGRTKPGEGWKKLGRWDLVIADEAHRLSNTDTLMHKAIMKVPSRRRLALSGSILQNHPEELYGVLHWLLPETYKAKWRDWCDRYVDFVNDGYGRVAVGFKPDRIETLRNELGVFMVYRRKEDELDLPPKTEQTLLVDISAGQRKAYDELRDQLWTELEDGTLVKAAHRLTLLNKLRQVATGLDSLGKTVEDSAKLDLAEDLILDAEDEPFVVFSWYKAPGRLLAERLEKKGVQCYVVDGDTKQEQRATAIARFQAGGGRVFIGTIATLGESVTLHRAANAIFLDRSWNPGANAQAADRIYRIGQARPVTITHLVARDTVDELRVQPALASKEALRAALFGKGS